MYLCEKFRCDFFRNILPKRRFPKRIAVFYLICQYVKDLSMPLFCAASALSFRLHPSRAQLLYIFGIFVHFWDDWLDSFESMVGSMSHVKFIYKCLYWTTISVRSTLSNHHFSFLLPSFFALFHEHFYLYFWLFYLVLLTYWNDWFCDFMHFANRKICIFMQFDVKKSYIFLHIPFFCSTFTAVFKP